MASNLNTAAVRVYLVTGCLCLTRACCVVWAQGQQPHQDAGLHQRQMGRREGQRDHRRHKCVRLSSCGLRTQSPRIDPATDEELGTVPEMGINETKEAIEVAGKVFKTWSKTTSKVCMLAIGLRCYSNYRVPSTDMTSS